MNDFAKRMVRINVFGTETERPPYMSLGIYNAIVEKLRKKEEELCNKHGDENEKKYKEVIRMIAWTYQRTCPALSEAKSRILKKVWDALDSGYDHGKPNKTYKIKGISPQYKTAFANLIGTNDELGAFAKKYVEFSRSRLEYADVNKVDIYGNGFMVAKVEKVDSWNWVMANLLMLNNGMTEFPCLPSKDAGDLCRGILDVSVNMLRRHLDAKKSKRSIKQILTILFFLLRRRKYEPKPATFMKEPQILLSLDKSVERIAKKYCDKELDDLSEVLMKFVRGNGFLDDMISVSESLESQADADEDDD